MGTAEALGTPDERLADRRKRFAIVGAAAAVLLLYVLSATFGARLLRRYAAETERIRDGRIAAATKPVPSDSPAVAVQVAINLNRIGALALKDSTWTADFDLSFRWKGDTVAPGKNFRIANGEIEQREQVDRFERGGERYEQYHVVARISKTFDASRFPFGDEGVVVEIEDTAQGVSALRYVADKANSGISTEAMPRRARLERSLIGVTVRRQGTVREARSQFFVAMLVASSSVPIFLNLFQALFAAVAVAFIVFFIKPVHVDPRFGLPVGGFFAAVSNNTYVSGVLPASDRVTLAAMVNAVGLGTIFLILVQSAASLYLLDTLGRERLSRFCDRTFFVVMLIGYVGINVALPLAAHH